MATPKDIKNAFFIDNTNNINDTEDGYFYLLAKYGVSTELCQVQALLCQTM